MNGLPLHCPICGLYCGQYVSVVQFHIVQEHAGAEIPGPEALIALAAEMRRTRHVWGALEALAPEA